MPILTIQQPTPNQEVKIGDTVLVQGSAEAPNPNPAEPNDIDSVTVQVDAQAPVDLNIRPSRTVGFSTSVQVTGDFGQHQITVRATDANGKTFSSAVPIVGVTVGGCAGNAPFRNFGRNFSVAPKWTCTPRSLDDIVAIVNHAESAQMRVHAYGSKWSFSECAIPLTPDMLVDTTQLNQPIQTVQQALAQGTGDPSLFFHVQAGITLQQLYGALNNFQDPVTGKARPLALQTMAGTNGQTLAGAISTGTHGADRLLAPIADSVIAVHLIGAGAQQYWIEPTNGVTDSPKLTKILPQGTKIIYDDSVFDSVLVSIGCMGIIYALVLRVRDQYSLVETTEVKTWRDFLASAAGLLNDSSTRCLQVLVDPYTDSNGANSCLVTTRKEGVPPSGVGQCGGNLQPALQQMQTDLQNDAWHRNPLGTPDFGALQELQQLQNELANGVSNEQVMVELTNYILETQKTDMRQILVNDYFEILSAAWPPGTCGGLSFEVMDTALKRGLPSASAVGGNSIEMSFQAIDANGRLPFADFVNSAITLINGATNTFLVGYVSLRFTGGTRACLGMQQWPQTCAVEISTLTGVDGLEDLLGSIYERMYEFNGVPHWGQLLDLPVPGYGNVNGHGSIYQRFNEWRQAYAKLSQGFTLRTFESDLSSRWQLTVPDAEVKMPIRAPDLSGLTPTEAAQAAQKLGLVVQVLMPGATVASQIPVPGVLMQPGSTIKVICTIVLAEVA